ncbi:MAG: hypothetical protein ABIL58_05820 [Pseudomonadota bacterium]
MKDIRKFAVLAIVAAVFAFGSVFATPALAGNTFFDDSTSAWLSGSSPNASVAVASQPCDPASIKKGGLSFLP